MAQLVRRSFQTAGLWLVLTSSGGCGDDGGEDVGDADLIPTSDAGGHGDSATDASPTGGDAGNANLDAAADAGGAQNDGSVSASCTSATTDLERAVCAANAFLATLSASELSSGSLAFSDAADRTKWSNLPGVTRAGLQMGSLSTTSQNAALALMQTVLSSAGVSDLTGIRAADDYLGSQSSGMAGAPGGGGMGDGGFPGAMGGMGDGGFPGAMGGGGGGYSSNNYYVAIFGTPSTSENWEITFGGHHMAYNVSFLGGIGYPVPNHLGVEPKASFTLDSVSYAPLEDEGNAMLAIFKSLSQADLNTAYLAGQTFADVLIGPVEYGTGSSASAKAKFPTGSNRTGVLVSSLTADQQALVTTAVQGWVSDYNATISEPLLAAYTSPSAYADTYVAWGGTQSAGVDPDINGTYMRIDGPRVWIEIACQAGVVIQGKTHYHTIFRDKQYDYAGTL